MNLERTPRAALILTLIATGFGLQSLMPVRAQLVVLNGQASYLEVNTDADSVDNPIDYQPYSTAGGVDDSLSQTAIGEYGSNAEADASFSTTLNVGQDFSFYGSGSIDAEATAVYGGEGAVASSILEAEEFFYPNQNTAITVSLIASDGESRLDLVDDGYGPDSGQYLITLTSTGTQTVELSEGELYGVEFYASDYASAGFEGDVPTSYYQGAGGLTTFSAEAAPEASTSAMMLAGLALPGFCARHRAASNIRLPC